MVALHSRTVDALWAAIEPRLSERPVDTHPLGCHRTRHDDRDCFEAILHRLVTGCSWDVAGRLGKGSETTLRRRFNEWVDAGVFEGLVDEALEYPGVDPFVESASQRGLRSFAESPGDVPRTARDEPMEDRFEAVAVVVAGTVTTQGVRIDGTFRKPGFDRSPEGIDGTRVQRDHDGVTSAGRSRVGWHPTSKSGQPNDWRMVASTPTYWRALLGPATG